MTDAEILELYLARSESAIDETAKQYGAYCTKIALNILHNNEDAEECVNDTYLSAWNSIPPQKPAVFSSFIGRITRNLSLDRYRKQKAQKRGGSIVPLLLGELEDCVPSGGSVEGEADARALENAVDIFLSGVGKTDRLYFVRRYWYADSIADIAKRFSAGESKVKTSLYRTRQKLKAHLEKEGIEI